MNIGPVNDVNETLILANTEFFYQMNVQYSVRSIKIPYFNIRTEDRESMAVLYKV